MHLSTYLVAGLSLTRTFWICLLFSARSGPLTIRPKVSSFLSCFISLIQQICIYVFPIKHGCFVKRREGWYFHLKCLINRVTESSLHREANLLWQKMGQSTLGLTIQLLQKMEDFSDTGSFSDHSVWPCSVLQERGVFLKEASKMGKCTM